MKITKYPLIFICIFLVGCSTTYKLSPKGEALRSSMTKDEAKQVLHELLTPVTEQITVDGEIRFKKTGLCSGVKFDDRKKLRSILVTDKGIEFDAYRAGKLLSSEITGSVSSPSGATLTQTFEKIYYRENLLFSNMKSVRVFEPGILMTVCFPYEGQSEIKVVQTTGMSDWYAAIIDTTQKDRFVAALLTLAPDANVTH